MAKPPGDDLSFDGLFYRTYADPPMLQPNYITEFAARDIALMLQKEGMQDQSFDAFSQQQLANNLQQQQVNSNPFITDPATTFTDYENLNLNQLIQPLMNATSLYPTIKKEPFSPSLFPGPNNARDIPNMMRRNAQHFNPVFQQQQQMLQQQQQLQQQQNLQVPCNQVQQQRISPPPSHITSPISDNGYEEISSDSSPSSQFSVHQQPNRGTKRPKSAEEREQARAEQQRNASRRYRQKKKVLVDQLEAKLQDILKEKERLEKEHRDTVETVSKLKKENASLKKIHLEDSAQLEKERLALLAKLDQLVRTDADDATLLAVIFQLRQCCKRISGLGECHSNLLISPNVVSQLVQNGFFEGPQWSLGAQDQSDGIFNFASKVMSAIPSITDEQKLLIQDIIAKYEEEVADIKAEREQLNKDITNYFSGKNPQLMMGDEMQMTEEVTDEQTGGTTHVPKMLSAMSTLEYLRKNLSEEVQKANMTMTEVMTVLTPRQQAQFHLEAEFQHKSVVYLKKMWDAMKGLKPGAIDMPSLSAEGLH